MVHHKLFVSAGFARRAIEIMGNSLSVLGTQQRERDNLLGPVCNEFEIVKGFRPLSARARPRQLWRDDERQISSGGPRQQYMVQTSPDRARQPAES